jgi:S-adenosylmethionine hydrolase
MDLKGNHNECMTIITLTTDFGLKDGFVGAMKGVIWSICPSAQLVDISHEITPQNVQEGSHVLARAASYFPAGTVHLAIVDPGVGTHRRPLVMQAGEDFFVGPDNGLFTPFLKHAETSKLPVLAVHLDVPQFWLPVVSQTFHGRDIFAPVAAHLARGIPLAQLGTPISDITRLEVPAPERTDFGWRARVTWIDVFGNISTNLNSAQIESSKKIVVRICGREISDLVKSYGFASPGDLVALVDSGGSLEVAVVNGSAARTLSARVGDPVDVFLD